MRRRLSWKDELRRGLRWHLANIRGAWMYLTNRRYKTQCIINILKWEGADMVAVYVALIIAGARTYAQVPALLKAQVRDALTAIELADLAK